MHSPHNQPRVQLPIQMMFPTLECWNGSSSGNSEQLHRLAGEALHPCHIAFFFVVPLQSLSNAFTTCLLLRVQQATPRERVLNDFKRGLDLLEVRSGCCMGRKQNECSASLPSLHKPLLKLL